MLDVKNIIAVLCVSLLALQPLINLKLVYIDHYIIAPLLMDSLLIFDCARYLGCKFVMWQRMITKCTGNNTEIMVLYNPVCMLF